MEAQLVRPLVRTRAPLPSLTKWTIASLLATTLTFVYLQLFITFEFSGPAASLIGITLILTAVVATGWRWAPLIAPIHGAWLTVITLDHIVLELAQPSETHLFAWVTVRLAIVLVGAVAGLVATIQNYRHTARSHTPRWFSFGVATLAALIVGAISVALIPQKTSAVGVSPEVMASAPTITMNDFNGGTARVKAGQIVAVMLDMVGSLGHIFDIDELNMHTPMSGKEVGLAVFKAVQPGSYTFYCAPHYDKASGTGMRGTLVVEP